MKFLIGSDGYSVSVTSSILRSQKYPPYNLIDYRNNSFDEFKALNFPDIYNFQDLKDLAKKIANNNVAPNASIVESVTIHHEAVVGASAIEKYLLPNEYFFIMDIKNE